jgi:kinetochore protein Spc7/SPC105
VSFCVSPRRAVDLTNVAEELEALEDLHMFRTTKVNPDLFEYVYASQLRVSIPCRKFIPIVARVEVTKLEKARSRFKDGFPRLSDFLLDMAKQQVVHKKDLAVRDVSLTLLLHSSSKI